MSNLTCDRKNRDKCVVRCDADVRAKLKAKPRVTCHQVNQKNTNFDVALKVKLAPDCIITQKGSHRSSCDPCSHVCLFNVELPITCQTEVIQNKCGQPSADFHLDVEVPVETECEIKNTCHDNKRPRHHNKHHALPSSKPEKSNVHLKAKKNYVEALSREAKSRSSPDLRSKKERSLLTK